MCCSKSISKCILIVMNTIFFLLGGGALALGVFLIVDKSYLLSIIGNIPSSSVFDSGSAVNATTDAISSTSFLTNGAYMLIGAGSVVFVIAFCGLCGGIRESKCLLYIYSTILLLVVAAEVAAGVLCYFYGTYVETYLQTWMTTLVTNYYYGATLGSNNNIQLSSDSTGISDALDMAQVSFQCCGVTNYTDYYSATNWPRQYNYTSGGSTVTLSNVAVPVSCCKLVNPGSWPSDLSNLQFVDLETCLTSGASNSTNLEACYTSVKALLVQYSTIAIGIGVGVACLEIFGLIAACCLIRSKGKNENEVIKVSPA